MTLAPENWRAGVLAIILRVTATLGFIAYIPSVYLAIVSGIIGVAVIDTLAMAAVIALLYFDNLPYRWRAAGCCLTFYVLAVGLLLEIGSISQIYLFGFSVLTAVLLGLRAGMFAALLSSATMLAVGFLGPTWAEVAAPIRRYDFIGWFVITLNFTLVNTTLTLAIGAVLAVLNNALGREIAARISLDHERTLLRTLIDTLPDIVFTTDTHGRYVNCNAAALALVGLDREEQLAGKTVFELYPRPLADKLHAEDLQVLAGGVLVNRDKRTVDRQGARLWLLTIKVPLRGPSGEIVGLIGISRNITDRKALESQLKQAQKMEAFGQLAGGVAHDFNNMLTIINGFSDVILSSSAPPSDQLHFVREIKSAGERAAALTRQLLAFSRKQILQAVELDLNTLVANIEKMLRRLIGEDIELTTRLDPRLGRIKADPGQIEQAIVNLVVNARDAMAKGGRLTIETRNIEFGPDDVRRHPEAQAGNHVMLAVTDTGCGMDEATRARVFEPFFTTKEIGKGTGLGLATVDGIVKQSNGIIEVASELGHGATFTIYLPRTDEAVAAHAADHGEPSMPRGTETILLVEDDDGVRGFLRMALESAGYTVLPARNGTAGTKLCKDHTGPIHLLVTDVVMPQMSGRELAEQVVAMRPTVSVLYVSGHTDDALVRHGVREAEMAFLQKPLTPTGLAKKVRELLDVRKLREVEA